MEKTVLLVEQDDRLARFMQVNLQADGHRVMRAAEGSDALTAAVQGRPDLVILDLVLPGLDGWWVMKQFKGSPRLRRIPILVVTALAEPEQRVQARRMGAVDYLVKPVGAGDLVAYVNRILNKDGGRRQGR